MRVVTSMGLEQRCCVLLTCIVLVVSARSGRNNISDLRKLIPLDYQLTDTAAAHNMGVKLPRLRIPQLPCEPLFHCDSVCFCRHKHGLPRQWALEEQLLECNS